MKIETPDGIYYIRGCDISAIKPLKDTGTSYNLSLLIQGEWLDLVWKYQVPEIDGISPNRESIQAKAVAVWNLCVTESNIR